MQIDEWLMDENDRCIFWLNGMAGTGKTTIAQTFAETSFADGKLGASFFCSRDYENKSNLQAIFPTLAFQLAYQYPEFLEQLLQVLRANPDVGRESLVSQFEKIIIRPLIATKIPTLIIIDALDECRDEEPASAILCVLAHYVHKIPKVKFFITGRPEPPIRNGFGLKSLHPVTKVLKLHSVERSSVDEDIRLFLKTRLTEIRETRSGYEFPEEWPSSSDIDTLCEQAGGSFIHASAAVKFISSKRHLPEERLGQLVSRSKGVAHGGGIDQLYIQTLDLAFRDVYTYEAYEEGVFARLRSVVGAIVLAFYPLSRKTLSELLSDHGTPSSISATLDPLHSLLYIPDGDDEVIRIFDKSFAEFLMDKNRCKDERFFIDPPVHHTVILFSCLDLMNRRLKKNICHLDDYAILSEVEDLSERTETYIGGALGYACRFWSRHLTGVPGNGSDVKRVQKAIGEFFETRLLCWIEVLSTTRHLNVAVYAIDEIRRWYASVSYA